MLWFDMVLHKVHHPLVRLPTKLEVGWRNNLLEVEYDSLVEKSYLALFMMPRDIDSSF